MRCYLCDKKRHFKGNCLEKGKSTKGETNSGDASATTDEMGYDNTEALALSSSNCEGTKFLDSGRTFHMTPYKEVNSDIVHIKNNHSYNVTRAGSMRLCLDDGSTFIMKNMRHVPH